jgi:hypothetical protein
MEANQFFVDLLCVGYVILVFFEHGGFEQVLGFVGTAQYEEKTKGAKYRA